jgi:anti-sigma B factor antagonist
MVDGVPVVVAPEEIDITNAPELRAALLEAAAHGHGTVVADLSRTEFCDSSGLHTLLAAHKRATAVGNDMLLVIPGNAVLRVFTITGVDQIIPNFTSLEEALAQGFANGLNGPNGLNGLNGPNGLNGLNGPNGLNGLNGYRRADGEPERQPSASGIDEGAG